jgi:hypothetical protein
VTLDDDDATRRALAVATTGVGERDPGAQRGGQDRLARPAFDESLIGQHVDVPHASDTLPRNVLAARSGSRLPKTGFGLRQRGR